MGMHEKLIKAKVKVLKYRISEGTVPGVNVNNNCCTRSKNVLKCYMV